jgi:uncharacterized membrane protein YoaK (UPF0700 family)
MGLSAACLFLAAFIARAEVFGFLSGGILLRQSYLLMALLCLASGLQNAAITSSSGRSVRTTHLTGLTTDLGLGLARVFTFDLKREHFLIEARVNYLRAGSIAAFIFGSAAGAWIFLRFHYFGFALSGLIATYAAWRGKRAKVVAHDLNFTP